MIRFQFLIVIFAILVASCNSEDAPDCLKTAGNHVQKSLEIKAFSRILVNPDIELYIEQGDILAAKVESGENLIDNIKVVADGDRLVLTNENSCNTFRKFNTTKVHITTPNLVEIRTASQFSVHSDGVLSFPQLRLISEDFIEESATTTGNFHLEIDSKKLSVISNNISSFFISGRTTDLTINFASGIGRFEGADLTARTVSVFHRGTNTIIVNPQESIKGELRSTGDLMVVNRPPIVEVKEFFKGKLRFKK